MCLIIFAYKAVEGCRLVLAANRDEWFYRPASPAAFWSDHPDVLAGRDLKASGTWLGISRRGRFAALTNFRSGGNRRDDAPSRGALVSDFLLSDSPAGDFLDGLASRAQAYNGFTLLAADASGLYCFSNRGGGVTEVAPGVHGLSNHLLDTPWPKVLKGKAGLEALQARAFNSADYLDLMDDSVPPDEQASTAPDPTEDWERRLSSMRIMKGDYGTRCSTALCWREQGESQFAERTYRSDGAIDGEVSYAFAVG